jgi:hypothetical protein
MRQGDPPLECRRPTSHRTLTTTGCSRKVTWLSPRKPRVNQFLTSFKDFPPSQRLQSFSVDQIVEKMQRSFDAVEEDVDAGSRPTMLFRIDPVPYDAQVKTIQAQLKLSPACNGTRRCGTRTTVLR